MFGIKNQKYTIVYRKISTSISDLLYLQVRAKYVYYVEQRGTFDVLSSFF